MLFFLIFICIFTWQFFPRARTPARTSPLGGLPMYKAYVGKHVRVGPPKRCVYNFLLLHFINVFFADTIFIIAFLNNFFGLRAFMSHPNRPTPCRRMISGEWKFLLVYKSIVKFWKFCEIGIRIWVTIKNRVNPLVIAQPIRRSTSSRTLTANDLFRLGFTKFLQDRWIYFSFVDE